MKRLCVGCVGETFLKAQISEGSIGQCDYCSKTDPSWPLDEVAEAVEVCFEQHFRRVADDAYNGEQVRDAIANAAIIELEPADDIQEILDSKHRGHGSDYGVDPNPFEADACYEERPPDDWAWQNQWRAFERSLKTESRYFNAYATEHLTSVFAGLEELRTAQGQSMIVEAGPETDVLHFYRARAFESDDALEDAIGRPDLHVGPPPPDAARAGRMNARGISMFYGAESRDTALAEVRPPVGSNVIVAKFCLARRVRLLDLQALASVEVTGSLFDPSFAMRREHAKFLEFVLDRMTKPVMPSSEEMDYMATQAVADFLASRETPTLDGILFPSVQVRGSARNVVLFQKASRVAAIDLPVGTELRPYTSEDSDEGPYPSFGVIEIPKATAAPNERGDFLPQPYWSNDDQDTREVTLAVDLEEVEVRHVTRADFKTDRYPVNRFRWMHRDIPF